MCFTSLNIGDAKLLKIDQIGEKNLTYYRIKNRNSKPEAIVVPLSSPARLLIRKIKKDVFLAIYLLILYRIKKSERI